MSQFKGFTIIEDVEVIILKSGVYKQVKVFQRNSSIYAATMGGFISLSRDGITSVPSIKWKDFITNTNDEFEYKVGKIGWLEIDK